MTDHVSLNIQPRRSNNNDTCTLTIAFCGGIFSAFLIIGLVSTSVLYVTYCCIALSNDKFLSDNCSNSYLWYYVLVSLIYCCVASYHDSEFLKEYSKEGRDKWTMICYFISMIIVRMGLGIWGFIELSEITSNLNNTVNITGITSINDINSITGITGITSIISPTNGADIHCKELTESTLWTMGVVSMILQFITGSIITIILACAICVLIVM